jgi:hypothetical protein
MLAPVALYPDSLLSQILLAAAYPADLIEAARWADAHTGLVGEEAVRAGDGEPWDPSVKALLAFPQVLAQLTGNLQWTQALGDAFVNQQFEVLDAVQSLRHRAQAAGNLRPDDQIGIVESGPDLLLQPRDPQVVYVPYYDPLLVYGTWLWPNYPPVYLRPWPAHFTRPAYAGLYYRGPPVIVSTRILDRAIDYRHRTVGIPPHVDRPRAPHRAADSQRVPFDRRAGAQPRFGPGVVPADHVFPARPADTRRIPLPQTQAPAERHSPQVHTLPLARPVSVNLFEPGAHREAPRAPQPPIAIPRAASIRPAETMTRPTPVARPVARQERDTAQVPHASPPRAEIRAPAVAAGQRPSTRAESRWNMKP